MKTAKIEISATETLFSNIYNAAAACATEFRNYIVRQREIARGKVQLAQLNDRLRQDIGMEAKQDRKQEIDRSWML